MNKKEFYRAVSEATENFADNGKRVSFTATNAVLDAAFDLITTTLANHDEVNITGFGKFCDVYVEEHMTGGGLGTEPKLLPAHYLPKFKASQNLKNAITSI